MENKVTIYHEYVEFVDLEALFRMMLFEFGARGSLVFQDGDDWVYFLIGEPTFFVRTKIEPKTDFIRSNRDGFEFVDDSEVVINTVLIGISKVKKTILVAGGCEKCLRTSLTNRNILIYTTKTNDLC